MNVRGTSLNDSYQAWHAPSLVAVYLNDVFDKFGASFSAVESPAGKKSTSEHRFLGEAALPVKPSTYYSQ